jgi:hypothetical protein
LFPLITPSPAAEESPGIASAFPVITPSPAATPPAGTPGSGQVRSGLPGRDEGLALSEPLAGSRPAGLVLIALGVAGAAGWLLLGRARKRRAPFTPSSVPATSPGIGRGIPGICPAAAPVRGRIPSGAPGWGLAPGEALAGGRQARLVLTLLAVAGAAGWLLLGRARKRRVP